MPIEIWEAHDGAGAKAYVSYTDNYEYLIRKDGIERKYLIVRGEEIPERLLIYTKDITEKNGVIISVVLQNNYGEYNNCLRAIKEQLGYLDNIYYDIPGFDNTYKIFRNPLFEWNSLHTYNELHISLKGIYYPINWSKLNIPKITIPLALKFDDYDLLQPVFNREELIWNNKSREGITQRIKDVADWFQEKYDEEVKEFDNFPEAFKHLRETDKFVSLGDKKIHIKELEPYMSKTCKGVEVKGLSLQTPHVYFTHLERMCRNFKLVGTFGWNGQYKSKNVYGDLKYAMLQEHKGVLLEQHPVGKVKDFLKHKYYKNSYFFAEPQTDLLFYKNALKLEGIEKSKWRPLIQELQELHKQIRTNFLRDETKVKESGEFLSWVEKQKEIAKNNKAAGIVTNYKTLDKQEGEVTIAYARAPLIGDIPVFEKKTYNIKELNKLNHILLIFDEENKEEAKNYYNLHKNLKVAIIGKREKTKLPEIHQIMEKEKFEKTKLFRRIITAIRVENALTRWNKITDDSESLVEKCLEKLERTKETLEQYKQDNFVNMRLGDEAKESFLILAKQYSLWDMEILPEVEKIEKALETFYFLEYIEYPRYGTEEDTRRVKKIINQLLLYQKKHGALSNYELVEKPVPDEMMQEQLDLEEEFISSEEAELTFA